MAVYSSSTDSVDLTSDPLVNCTLCLDECKREEMIVLKDCQCTYCKTCMKQYLTILITEGSVLSITCPDAMCRKRGKVQRSEIQSLLSSSYYERYVRIKFQKEVELDPGRTFCPQPECESLIHICQSPEAGAGPSSAKPVSCPSCTLVFCSVCKSKWHDGKTCDENGVDGIPFNNSVDAEIKRCPLCFVPIERTDGCAQMMCRRCRHVFCWFCLAPLDDDFLLRHYDKGPCKNKLGHSRASVIWHRTQVVGIFASFGVLLLVVSPLLLLAAPCILCCKCAKISKCCEDDDENVPQ